MNDQVQASAAQLQFNEWSNSVTEDDNDVRWLRAQAGGVRRVLDVGGGNGRFASILAGALGCEVDVVDPSPAAREQFTRDPRCRFVNGDFLRWDAHGTRYDLVCFRLVLHHLLGQDDATTADTQLRALRVAASLLAKGGRVYVLENIYEPMVGTDTTGRMIYEATRLKVLAAPFRRLGANTAGEGVRFRSLDSWRSLVAAAGLAEQAEDFNHDPGRQVFPAWQRLPFLCRRRFEWLALLGPRAGAATA